MSTQETLSLLRTFISKGYMMPAQIVGNIAMVGLIDPDSPKAVVKTLRKALQEGTVQITERGGYTKLHVVTPEPILIRKAQAVVKGGQQDRIFKYSQVVSGAHDLDVYCIERGRWHGKEPQWVPAEIPIPFKRMAAAGIDQSQLWSNIGEYLRRSRTTTTSSALSAVYDALGKDFEKFVGNFEWWRDQIGMIVIINNVVAGMEVFDSFETFHDEGMPVLRDSYVPEALQATEKQVMTEDDITKALATFIRDLETGRRKADIVEYQNRILYIGVV